MTYATVEQALADIIVAGDLAGFNAADVGVGGDYRVLNGSHKYVAVIDYAGFHRVRESLGGGDLTVWKCTVTLGVQYRDDAQTGADASALRQEIITQVSENPNLGLGSTAVREAFVTDGRDVSEVIDWGGIQWALEEVDVEITEPEQYDEEED